MSRRRRRRRAGLLLRSRGDDDQAGILDVLANLVGVLTLVGALSAIIAGQSAVRLRTPMSRRVDQPFLLLQVGEAGIWNLEPARTQLGAAQQARYDTALACLTDPERSIASCRQRADSYRKQIKTGSATLTTTALNLSLQRHQRPDLPLAAVEKPDGLPALIQQAREQGKALFVLLEPGGVNLYRLIRTQATEAGVAVGWEPWDTGRAVIFGKGRAMTIQ